MRRDLSYDGTQVIYQKNYRCYRAGTTTVVNGVIYRRYAAYKEDCAGCELKLKCMINVKGERRVLGVPIGYATGNLSKAMADKIDSEKRRKIYSCA